VVSSDGWYYLSSSEFCAYAPDSLLGYIWLPEPKILAASPTGDLTWLPWESGKRFNLELEYDGQSPHEGKFTSGTGYIEFTGNNSGTFYWEESAVRYPLGNNTFGADFLARHQGKSSWNASGKYTLSEFTWYPNQWIVMYVKVDLVVENCFYSYQDNPSEPATVAQGTAEQVDRTANFEYPWYPIIETTASFYFYLSSGGQWKFAGNAWDMFGIRSPFLTKNVMDGSGTFTAQ